LPKKPIAAKTTNVQKGGQELPFETKRAQAATMIIAIASCFAGSPILVVTDSWLGNNGLFKPVRVVWVYRQTQWLALFTTDLRLSVEQIIELYGARWKIESGFKELKPEIGSQKSQTRNAYAVTNPLQFCMMAVALTWIYAARLRPDPERRHKVKGRTSFAFSDVRRIIAEAALDENFEGVCPKPTQSPRNSLVTALLRMVA
jgi:hypothetical protein